MGAMLRVANFRVGELWSFRWNRHHWQRGKEQEKRPRPLHGDPARQRGENIILMYRLETAIVMPSRMLVYISPLVRFLGQEHLLNNGVSLQG